jgi:hypothetical protein
MLMQALGGAVAIVVGAYIFNSNGPFSSFSSITGTTTFLNSHITLNENRFSNCSAVSFTGGSESGSLGASSVYGGALAIVQSPHVSSFILGSENSAVSAIVLTGFNLTVMILSSSFNKCSALTNSTSVRPGAANGGGGAVYANSVALAYIILSSSNFSSSSVTVACGATGAPSNSSGGALAIELTGSNHSFVAISSCSFLNCTAQGANISNLAVRGGAVAVSRVSSVSVTGSHFINCSLADAAISNQFSSTAVSGGAGMSVVFAQNVSIDRCLFDAAGGRDDSGTSTGAILLASKSSPTHVSISSSSLRSSSVALNIQCVSDDGASSVQCPQSGPSVSLTNSNITQLASSSQADFGATGSPLISFQYGVLPLFLSTRMQCAVPQFAAFKKASPDNSQNVYSCSPCAPFQISLSANAVLLEQLLNAADVDRCISVSNLTNCPFGFADCSTFVNVSSGFWTSFSSSTSNNLTEVSRCPPGYCGCGSSTCALTPLLSINRRPDPLCSGNRTGFLCGGCRPNFTQSIDGETCISNDVCTQNLWWVWALSVLGFALFSLGIVVSCAQRGSGETSCLLFYLQMSSFASSVDESGASSAILQFSQFRSIFAVYSGACYAPDFSAYNATAAGLIGPLFVLVFAVAWTWVLRALQLKMQQRNIQISVSYSGTLIVTLLFVFSSVANVVFTLVQCTTYNGGGVVFIDGTVPCNDNKWKVLTSVVVLLCLFPAAFAAALQKKKLPNDAQAAVCHAFTASSFYWGAVTLGFRLLISVSEFLQVEFPNLLAVVRLFLSTFMLLLLLYLRPYVHLHTFWVDVVCYLCLIAQFALQIMAADRDYLGVAASPTQAVFFSAMSSLSAVFRSPARCTTRITPALPRTYRSRAIIRRYLPVAVYAVAWLRTKLSFGNIFRAACSRMSDLANAAKRRICRKAEQPEGHEMKRALMA